MMWDRVRAESRSLPWLRMTPLRRLAASVFRPVTRRLPFLERDMQRPRGDEDLVPVEIIEGSAIVRAIAASLATLGRAADDSVAARTARSAAEDFCARPLAARVRLTSTVLLTAVITHILLTQFDAPAPLFVARAAWVAIAGVLALCIAAAPAIAAAWRDRQ